MSAPTLDTVLECASCGYVRWVSYATCLAHGWPRCCDSSMRMLKSPGPAAIEQAVGEALEPVREITLAARRAFR